jgi:hypothetical protein
VTGVRPTSPRAPSSPVPSMGSSAMPITLALPLATSISTPASSSRVTPTNDLMLTSKFVTPWENDDNRLDAVHVELLVR